MLLFPYKLRGGVPASGAKDFSLVRWVLFLVAITWIMFNWAFGKVQRPVIARAPSALTFEQRVATEVPGVMATAQAAFTPTVIPTLVPSPTATPFYPAVRMSFRYSYYDPTLGGVNCAEWDNLHQVCMSMMSSGDDWRDYYGRALACPVVYPLGTVFTVLDPVELRGDWVCLDRGGMIIDDYLDFLDTRQRLSWASVVIADVTYPVIPIQPKSGGTH